MLETQTYTIQIEECERPFDIQESLSPIRNDVSILRSRICVETDTGFVLVKSSLSANTLQGLLRDADAYVTIHRGDKVDDLIRQEQLNFVD